MSDTTRWVRNFCTSASNVVSDIGIFDAAVTMEASVEPINALSLYQQLFHVNLSLPQQVIYFKNLAHFAEVILPIWAITEGAVSLFKDLTVFLDHFSEFCQDDENNIHKIGMIKSLFQMMGDGKLIAAGVSALGNAAFIPFIFMSAAIKYGIDFCCALSEWERLEIRDQEDMSEDTRPKHQKDLKNAREAVIDKAIKFAGFTAISLAFMMGGHLVGFAFLAIYVPIKYVAKAITCCFFSSETTSEDNVYTGRFDRRSSSSSTTNSLLRPAGTGQSKHFL